MHTAPIRSSSASISQGLEKKKLAPRLTASLTACSVQRAESTMTFGAPASCSPIRFMRAKPSNPGSTTSIKTRSGCSSSQRRSASAPSPVAPATVNPSVPSITFRSMPRNSSLASASNTVLLLSMSSLFLFQSFWAPEAAPRLAFRCDGFMKLQITFSINYHKRTGFATGNCK